MALVALDKGPQLCDTYGQPVMDQLHCFVGNQWKKHYDTPMHQVVCRLTGSIFVVGSVDTTGPQLAARMQELYEQMPHECITTTGMMHRVQFTMSGAAAGLDEVEAKNWPPSTSCAMPACARCRLPAVTGSAVPNDDHV